jgi:hypothetical protein
MIGFPMQDVCVNKMVKTKNRYIPLDVSQVGHFQTPKIHGNLSDHGGTLDGSPINVPEDGGKLFIQTNPLK